MITNKDFEAGFEALVDEYDPEDVQPFVRPGPIKTADLERSENLQSDEAVLREALVGKRPQEVAEIFERLRPILKSPLKAATIDLVRLSFVVASLNPPKG